MNTISLKQVDKQYIENMFEKEIYTNIIINGNIGMGKTLMCNYFYNKCKELNINKYYFNCNTERNADIIEKIDIIYKNLSNTTFFIIDNFYIMKNKIQQYIINLIQTTNVYLILTTININDIDEKLVKCSYIINLKLDDISNLLNINNYVKKLYTYNNDIRFIKNINTLYNIYTELQLNYETIYIFVQFDIIKLLEYIINKDVENTIKQYNYIINKGINCIDLISEIIQIIKRYECINPILLNEFLYVSVILTDNINLNYTLLYYILNIINKIS